MVDELKQTPHISASSSAMTSIRFLDLSELDSVEEVKYNHTQFDPVFEAELGEVVRVAVMRLPIQNLITDRLCRQHNVVTMNRTTYSPDDEASSSLYPSAFIWS